MPDREREVCAVRGCVPTLTKRWPIQWSISSSEAAHRARRVRRSIRCRGDGVRAPSPRPAHRCRRLRHHLRRCSYQRTTGSSPALKRRARPRRSTRRRRPPSPGRPRGAAGTRELEVLVWAALSSQGSTPSCRISRTPGASERIEVDLGGPRRAPRRAACWWPACREVRSVPSRPPRASARPIAPRARAQIGADQSLSTRPALGPAVEDRQGPVAAPPSSPVTATTCPGSAVAPDEVLGALGLCTVTRIVSAGRLHLGSPPAIVVSSCSGQGLHRPHERGPPRTPGLGNARRLARGRRPLPAEVRERAGPRCALPGRGGSARRRPSC